MATAICIYAFGLVAPLTPSTRTPSVLDFARFALVPAAVATWMAACSPTRAGRVACVGLAAVFVSFPSLPLFVLG